MEEPSRPVITNRTRRYVSKPNSLRYLCGGRLHKWLALFLPSRERGWTPWPGWPASRLILAQYVPESCSSPSTDRVTMDTIIRAWPLSVARWRRLWRKKDWPDFRKRCEAAAFPWTTPSKRSRSLRARCGAPGTEKLQASRVPSGRLQPKRFWRHCWARFHVLKSEGNLNNEYGLPLTLFRLEDTHEAAVLEMGMSRRGELSRLAAIA